MGLQAPSLHVALTIASHGCWEGPEDQWSLLVSLGIFGDNNGPKVAMTYANTNYQGSKGGAVMGVPLEEALSCR